MLEKRPLAVILTALSVEAKAIRAMLSGPTETRSVQNTFYDFGEFTTGKGNVWELAVTEIGMGIEAALIETNNVICNVKPEFLLFVGVAGGVKDVRVGDVVVGNKVYGYEGVKVDELMKARPETVYPDDGLISLARNIAGKDDWFGRIHHEWLARVLKRAGAKNEEIPVPESFVGPIATGGKVVTSRKSAYYDLIKKSYNDTLALEMEGYGCLRGVRGCSGLRAIVIRGISDLLDKKGESDASGSQEIASAHAAAFAFELLAQYLDIHQGIKTPDEQLPAVDSPPSKQEDREPEEADRLVMNNSSTQPVISEQRIVEEGLTPVQQMIEEHVCEELERFPDLLQLVREKLGEQLKGETAQEAAKILCRHQVPRWPLDSLKDPVFSFLDKLQLNEPAKLPYAVERVKTIIGWLLLRAVDERFLIDQIGQPAPDQGFRLEIGLHEYAPVEVVIAFTGKRSAGYQTEIQADQVYGLGAIDLNRLAEFGYRKEDQVEGMIRAVWKIVYGADRPEVKGDNPEEQRKDRLRLDQRLNAALSESGRWAKEFYCMVSGNEQDNPLNDPDVIELLRYRLPRLKMIAFGVKGRGTGMIWAGEELSEYVRNFLIALRNYR